MINWSLIRYPANWAIVVLMLLIVSFVVDALLRRVNTDEA